MRNIVMILSENEAFAARLEGACSCAGLIATSFSREPQVIEESRARTPSLILVDRRHAGFVRIRRELPTHVLIVSIHEHQSMCVEEHCAADLDNGADFSLCNPTPNLLMALVRSALRRLHARTAAHVQIAQRVRFELDNYQVIVDGQIKMLTPKECLIFRTLLSSVGRVILKREIIDIVWGENYAVGEHSLNVHIWKLRQKIERNPSQPTLIVTMRGVGFLLKAEPPASWVQESKADSAIRTTAAYIHYGHVEERPYVQLPDALMRRENVGAPG